MGFLVPILLLFLCGSVFADLAADLEVIRASSQAPALAAASSVRGVINQIAAVGVRKLGDPTSVTIYDKFHLGSCTKSMTAMVAAMLVEEGKLDWKQPLAEILQETELHPQFQNVTFDQLFAHRAGFRRDVGPDGYAVSTLDLRVARKTFSEMVLKNAPVFSPGTHNYSNVGYIVAGHILEKVSGKSWEMLMQEKLFIPLGMKSCGFGKTSISGEVNISQLWGHDLLDGRLVPAHADNYAFLGPAGTVHCSLPDWNKYLYLHVEGFHGKDNLLQASSYQKLHSTFEDGEYTYGGWHRFERGWAQGPALNHTGSNNLNFANVWIGLKTKTILMSTSNRGTKDMFEGTDKALGSLLRNLK